MRRIALLTWLAIACGVAHEPPALAACTSAQAGTSQAGCLPSPALGTPVVQGLRLPNLPSTPLLGTAADGSLIAGTVPPLSAAGSIIGGVQAITCTGGQAITSIGSGTGVPVCSVIPSALALGTAAGQARDAAAALTAEGAAMSAAQAAATVNVQNPYFTVPNPPPTATVQGDSILLRFFGAIGDGNSHPISTLIPSVYPTLAAAQAAYHDTTMTLTEERDVAAMNLAVYQARQTRTYAQQVGATYFTGGIGRIVSGTGTFMINKTADLTQLRSTGFAFDFTGSVWLCAGAGLHCFDTTGSLNVEIHGLHVVGETPNTPDIGVLNARESNNYGSDYVNFYDVTTDGYFNVSSFHNTAAEEMTIFGGIFENRASNAYVMALDGQNSFGVCSSVPGVACLPQNNRASFNNFTCYSCKLHADPPSANTPDLFMSGAGNPHFYSGYFHQFGSVKAPAVVMDFSHGLKDYFSYFDVHFESTQISPMFRLQGASNILIDRLTVRDPIPFATGSLFGADAAGAYGPAVTSVQINSIDFNIGSLPLGTAWLDNPALYTISGNIAGTDSNGYNLIPAQSSVSTCFGATCSNTGSTATIPANLPVAQLYNPGVIDGIAVTNIGSIPRYAQPIAVTIAPPPSGAVAATAAVVSYQLSGAGAVTSGNTANGYALFDVLTDTSDAACTTPIQWTVTQIDNGALNGPGHPTRVARRTRGVCPSYVHDPIAVSAASGAVGLTISGSTMGVLSVAVSNPTGTDYANTPAVVFGSGGGRAPTGYATLHSSIQVAGGGNSITLSDGVFLTTAPLTDVAGVTGGIVQTLSTFYTPGQPLAYGSLVGNAAGQVYQVINACTPSDPNGPTVTNGSQATSPDGCGYLWLAAGLAYPQLQVTDQGVAFLQPISMQVIGQPAMAATLGATLGQPVGPFSTGSVMMDATGGAPYYQNAAGVWVQLSSASGESGSQSVPKRVPGWYASDKEMARKPCAAAAPGQVAYYPVWVEGTTWVVSKLGVTTTGTAEPGGAIRLGLYADGGNSPGTLLGDFGEVSTAAVGQLSTALIAAPVTLQSGLNWVEVQTDTAGSAAATIEGELCTAGGTALSCFGQQAMGSNGPYGASGPTPAYGLVSSNINIGALPATDPGTLGQTASACIPAVSFYLTGFAP